MNQILCLMLIVATANCYYIEYGPAAPKDRIVEGEEVNIKDVPYVAQLAGHKSQLCGASIISEYWLITAAHCFIDRDHHLSIITGATTRSNDGNNHEIDEIIVHENFTNASYDNDIALIKLKRPIEIGNSRKTIGISKTAPKTGDKLRISGYGRVSEWQSMSPILKSAVVPAIDFDVCQKQYEGDTLTDNMFCAGIGNTDACEGDSGGPAVVNGKLVGIISNGIGCAWPEYAGIYTKVANYLDWIKKHSGLTY